MQRLRTPSTADVEAQVAAMRDDATDGHAARVLLLGWRDHPAIDLIDEMRTLIEEAVGPTR